MRSLKMKTKKKIIITGTSGYAGFEIYKSLSPLYDIYSIDLIRNDQIKSNQFIFDLSDEKNISKIDKLKFDCIVHTAGTFNNQQAIQRSANLDENIINFAKDSNTPLIYFSTFLINVTPNSDYSQLKLKAEKLIKKNLNRFIILRPESIYSKNEKKINFYKKFKFLNSTISFPNKNVMRSPVHINDLIQILIKSISNNLFTNKIYQAGGTPITYEKILKICNNNNIYVFNLPKFIKFFAKQILYLKFGKTIIDGQDLDRISINKELLDDFDVQFLTFEKGINV